MRRFMATKHLIYKYTFVAQRDKFPKDSTLSGKGTTFVLLFGHLFDSLYARAVVPLCYCMDENQYQCFAQYKCSNMM